MFTRILSLRLRTFSMTNIRFLSKTTEVTTSLKNEIAPQPKLPSFLPAPTGVKSKLFDEYYLVYRLGFHQPLRFIQVVKVSQAVAASILAPYRLWLYHDGLLSLFDLNMSLFVLSLSSLSLFTFGWAATRTICYLYTNIECDRVILTHIDFWGRRRNIEIDTRDIVPINDIETPNRIILPFRRYSIDRTMYYSALVGQILDRPRFNRIFAGIITQDKKDWW